MYGFVICVIVAFLDKTVAANTKFHITLDANDLECIKELGLDTNKVTSAFYDNLKIQEENPEINKFFNCAWNKSGFVDKNNEANKDKIKKWLTQWDIRDMYDVYEVNNVKNLSEVVDDCINICLIRKNPKSDDMALKMYNCLLDCLLWKRLYRK
ncbi:hypothetical protein RN001_014123 [Aquatica leii]|uniref:Uncharacterized protein n=1 Tax=Aquatica leii TaxID=1421715 RepID=A0AAN7P3Q8_9COLE|nr:hypothetical protein RN001_014123 [Aquatica leii]